MGQIMKKEDVAFYITAVILLIFLLLVFLKLLSAFKIHPFTYSVYFFWRIASFFFVCLRWYAFDSIGHKSIVDIITTDDNIVGATSLKSLFPSKTLFKAVTPDVAVIMAILIIGPMV